MREMKAINGYKVGYIKSVPDNWEIDKGKYIFVLVQRKPNIEDGVITCFRDGQVTLRSNRREEGFTISEKEIGYQGIKSGDLIVHGMDGFAGAIGISDSDGKASPVLNVLDTKNSKKYCMYLLRNMAFEGVFIALATGIRVRTCDTNFGKLRDIYYLIPPLSEQQAIAEFLDRKCGEIDEIAKLIEEQIETLENYKRSLITETVTKGLDKSAKMKDSGIAWIGEIPEHWKVERLQWHLYEINEKNCPIKTTNVLSLTNKKGVIPYEEKGPQGNISKENYSEYHLAYKDTIVANSMNILIGSVGYSNYYGCVSPVYYVFKEKPNNDLHFINYIMQTTKFQKELRKYANGILEIRLRVSSKDILKRKVAFPPLSEQQAIAVFLDRKCGEIDEIITAKQKQLETLGAYKQSMIYEYVTGKKEVTNA